MESNNKIEIILTVFGDLFNPADFTKLVKITPSISWLKGETAQKSKVIRKESAWKFSTSPIKTLFFKDVSPIILSKFEEKINLINKTTLKYGTSVKLEVILDMYNGQASSISLNERFITFLNNINAKIHFDIYIETE